MCSHGFHSCSFLLIRTPGKVYASNVVYNVASLRCSVAMLQLSPSSLESPRTQAVAGTGLDVVQAGTGSFRGYPWGPWFGLSEDRLAMAAARVSTWMAGIC